MSDRRPEKLYVWKGPYPLNVATDANEFVETNLIREATVDEALAVVRAGVESGTIEGRMAECLECNSEGVTSCRPFPCEHGGHTCVVCRGRGRVLVIPVDVGEVSGDKEAP